MRRLATLIALLAVLGAAVVTTGARDDGAEGRQYTVEFDNAFGLVEGADLKVAGVRAGTIDELRLDRRTKRALVDISVTKTGFGSFREDVFCESRPQSLIGEYFVDCLPGTKGRELPEGARIPVTRTASTISPDVINNIMRRPKRERFRIILNELGAGVGARAEDIQAVVRRGVPALRETNRVLGILADQNQTLKNLVEDGDEVIGALAGNKEDVSRWVRETRQTAAASAERREDIAAGLRKLPGFLRELRPTMAQLGAVADAQQPSLRDLNASAAQLEELFENLAPFSRSTQVNLRSLGEAAEQGRPAVRAARPVVSELNRFSEKTPEVANNLAIILGDLDDRGRAVEPDPRSPGGKGYTGFEALLQYVFDQALAINIFNSNGYMLKVNLFVSECSEAQNAGSLKEHEAEHPGFIKRCGAYLGPNQQGINQPDPTHSPSARSRTRRSKRNRDGKRDGSTGGGEDRPQNSGGGDAGAPPIDLGDTIEDLLDGRLPDVKAPATPKVPATPDIGLGAQDTKDDALLDFLFGR